MKIYILHTWKLQIRIVPNVKDKLKINSFHRPRSQNMAEMKK